MVLGDSMVPEFAEGDVIVIEPDGLATDGSFVLANPGGEWTFRQLAAAGERAGSCAPSTRAIPPSTSTTSPPCAAW